MKMILNNRYFGKSLLLVSACSLWILGACTGDFMETNTDPNAVTEEELGYDNLHNDPVSSCGNNNRMLSM